MAYNFQPHQCLQGFRNENCLVDMQLMTANVFTTVGASHVVPDSVYNDLDTSLVTCRYPLLKLGAIASLRLNGVRNRLNDMVDLGTKRVEVEAVST